MTNYHEVSYRSQKLNSKKLLVRVLNYETTNIKKKKNENPMTGSLTILLFLLDILNNAKGNSKPG